MAIDMFPFLEIFMPFVGLGITILCCTSLCKACHNAQEEMRRERTDTPSIFVIPFPPAEDRTHNPPRYSMTDFSSLPPPYAEVERKPELFPHPEGVPPPYTEVSLPLASTAPPPPTPPPLPRATPFRRMSYA
ncbi:hypothetical protein SKAU_G00298380 [Synaphobranchus kaupii]|uniref:Transmembrane protein 92 n=1 Tax=Synaphobranchus kaupii TaxID=118154 RepID=A0A9Q1EV73_SYNKA|nr:hypothetical protein SKAU_G00298380 [Synaphobranchus kaupii]